MCALAASPLTCPFLQPHLPPTRAEDLKDAPFRISLWKPLGSRVSALFCPATGCLLSAIRETPVIPGPLRPPEETKTKRHQKVYRESLVHSIGDEILRELNSGRYFQIKVLLFGEVLFLKPKEKRKHLSI